MQNSLKDGRLKFVDKQKPYLYMAMHQHLKPLYIRIKVNDMGINKVLIDCMAYVNVIAQYL